MFALSTSWNAWQHKHAKDMIAEIKRLGFDQVELSFSLSATIVKEMLALKRRGQISVLSVHNFCPIPKGVRRRLASPDMFSLSALDENERKQALRHTQNTIDTARNIGAAVVVLHVGKVKIEEQIKQLAGYYLSGEQNKFRQLKSKMRLERAAKAKEHFSQALRSLDQLCGYAQKQKIKLGVENRYYFSEIPSLEEMETILNKFPGPPLYYWHDVGHAQVYDNLGFVGHRTILKKFSRRMIGIHLHDINGITDHLAPLQGKFDFSVLNSHLSNAVFKVLEPHYPATAAEITRGRIYLEKLFSQ
ncbi:sugar phosphate isomerase/epimerase family protein [Candidatus Omnitrophota bacterium]